jgi:hypothetical protein
MPNSQHPNHAEIKRAWVRVSEASPARSAIEIAGMVATMFEGLTTWKVLMIVSEPSDTPPGPNPI